MFSRRCFPGLLALLATPVVLLTAIPARADTVITLSTAGIVRNVPIRTNTTTSLWISRSDCLAGDVLTFPVVATGQVGSLEVWASNGASCLPPESRNSSAAQCWKVFSGAFTNSVFSVPIKVQDIAAEQRPPQFPASIGDINSCTPPAGTASAAQPITLFFMDILGDQNEGGTSWETKLDLVGPQPPTAPLAPTKALNVGNTLLIPAWSATGDIDVAGYDFFCAPVAGGDAAAGSPATGFGAGAGDATTTTTIEAASNAGGACSDASADGGVSDASDDACTTGSTATTTSDAAAATTATSDAAVAVTACGPIGTGIPPTAEQLNLLCGSVTGATATSFNITGLTNDVQYEVAVGAVDAVGNVGPLGLANCATPQVTIGFPENYHNAGGTAGGGFCSVGRVLPGRTGWSWGLGTLLGLGMALRLRRRPQASSCHTV